MNFFKNLFMKPIPTQHLTRVNPQEVLFSMPTINDEVPSLATEKPLSADALILHEDDWRQCELISSSLRNEIDAELADINEIWKSQSVQTGSNWAFKNLHVRKRITQPISPPLSSPLLKHFTTSTPCSLSFQGLVHPLRHVAATRIDGWIFYGEDNGITTRCLGLQWLEQTKIDGETSRKFVQLMENHDLVFVHWPSRTLFPTTESVKNYLDGKSPNP